MKHFIASLVSAALLCFVSGAADAAIGHPFLKNLASTSKELASPETVANKVEQSLKVDPTGNALIDPTHCNANEHACATPMHFLQAFQKEDPGAGLTSVQELPAFFRSLVLTTVDPANEYYSACLEDAPGGYVVFADCVSRPFHKGEKAYMNPKTHKVDLQGDCANPVGQINAAIVVTPCAFIEAELPDNAVGLAFAGLRPVPVTDHDRKCLAFKSSTDDEYVEVLPDDCPEIACNFTADVGAVGFPVQWRGSKSVHGGTHMLRVPREYADAVSKGTTVLCVDVLMPDGRRVHSMALGVRNVHYGPGFIARIHKTDWQYPVQR